MSERLPDPVRDRPRTRPRALLAIDWSGPLTCEDPVTAEAEHGRWLANVLLEANRATVVRPCPNVDRLFSVMEQPGKVTRDAPYPQAFRGWQP